MTCGIYKITNKINGKMYIGQSVDIEKRLKRHKQNSKTKDSHLYKAIRKYGLDNFVFEVIVECDEHMLDEFEIGIIKLYDTTNPEKGYNKTFGGEGGRKSDETKNKMSKASKGKPKSDEHKRKMSKSKKGNISRLGMLHSTETKTKISESNKGKPKSDEHKKNITNAKKNMTNETKQKMSNAKKGNQHNLKQYQYQGNIYNGRRELADFLGITYSALAKRIHKKTIDVKSYTK